MTVLSLSYLTNRPSERLTVHTTRGGGRTGLGRGWVGAGGWGGGGGGGNKGGGGEGEVGGEGEGTINCIDEDITTSNNVSNYIVYSYNCVLQYMYV